MKVCKVCHQLRKIPKGQPMCNWCILDSYNKHKKVKDRKEVEKMFIQEEEAPVVETPEKEEIVEEPVEGAEDIPEE